MQKRTMDPNQEVKVQNKIVAKKDTNENKQKTIIYSWKNEDGYRGYSNTGFPADGKYTDPKIEWKCTVPLEYVPI